MKIDKSGNIIGDKEMGNMIAAELSGAFIQSIFKKINPEELKKHFKDMNVSAIALNVVHDPETNQIRTDEVKIGINFNFK